MSNSKLPWVSVKVPSQERGVTVRVKPPESRLYLMVTNEGEALEIKVSPEGSRVEVSILPLEDIPEQLREKSLGQDFSPGAVPQSPPPDPSGLSPSQPDSSYIVVESGDLTVLKEMASSTALAMKLSEPLAEIVNRETLLRYDVQAPSEVSPTGLEPNDGALPFAPEPLDPASSGLLKVSQTQALLSQLPDLEPVLSYGDDSRGGTAYTTILPPLADQPGQPDLAQEDPGGQPEFDQPELAADSAPESEFDSDFEPDFDQPDPVDQPGQPDLALEDAAPEADLAQPEPSPEPLDPKEISLETSIDRFIAKELSPDYKASNVLGGLFKGDLNALAAPKSSAEAPSSPKTAGSIDPEKLTLEGSTETFFCEPFDPALDQSSALDTPQDDSPQGPSQLAQQSLDSEPPAGLDLQEPLEDQAPSELDSDLNDENYDFGQAQPQDDELDSLADEPEPVSSPANFGPKSPLDLDPLEPSPYGEPNQEDSFEDQAQSIQNQNALSLEAQEPSQLDDQLDDQIIDGQPILGDGEADGSTFLTLNPPLALDDQPSHQAQPEADLEPSPTEPSGQALFTQPESEIEALQAQAPQALEAYQPSQALSDEPGPPHQSMVIDGYRLDPHAPDELDDETPAVFEAPAQAQPQAPAAPGNDFLDQVRASLFGESDDKGPEALDLRATDEHLAALDEPGYDPVNDPAGTSVRTQPLSDLSELMPTLHSSPSPRPEAEEDQEPPISASLVPDPSVSEARLATSLPEEDELDFTDVLEPSLEPQIATNIPPALPPQILYTPPRPVPKVISPEASTAVIVNYLEDTDDSMLASQGKVDELAEDEDMDIDLMDMHSQEPIRLEAKPMIPVPKTTN
ncbi:MAG: hypothetical protein LBE80_00420 [Deltaproteobacteria bacterium]|jgi:hypothetical protein|nr:hypothetical protein [Deltaproteobacteria bacterium]